MPHGYPPWSGIIKKTVFSLPVDLGELAARLGSIVTFDRRGDVIWLTSFEEGRQGSGFAVDHVDSKGTVSTNRAMTGAYSIRLDPRAVADAYVNWTRVLHFLVSGKIGLEVNISLDNKPLYVHYVMFYHKPTYFLDAHLRYAPATGNWDVETTNGAWESVWTGLVLQTGPNAWHPIKMVIDTEAETYVRLLVDRYTEDLSTIPLRVRTPPGNGQMQLKLECTGSVAASEVIHLDNIIVTQNEP